MRIAITGGAGLLGRSLVLKAVNAGHLVTVGEHKTPVPHPEGVRVAALDLSSGSSTRDFVNIARPACVIHAAAMTDVDRCELRPLDAEEANVEAVGHLMRALEVDDDVHVIYISTDYVFDGVNGPYSEEDTPNPVNVYGRTKLAGEDLTRRRASSYTIIRTASLLGHGTETRPSFADKLLEVLRRGEKLRVPHDQVSNITPVEDLAAAVIEAAERKLEGTWHVSGPGIISRYDFALLLAKAEGTATYSIEAVQYASLDRPARRPLHGGLTTDKMRAHLITRFRPLEAAVAEFVARR